MVTAPPDDLDAQPLFLLGAPRSGTSLLYKALCLHSGAAYISNWVARWPQLPQLAALNRVAARLPAWQQRVWFGGGDSAYVYGRARPAWHRAFPMPVEGEPVYARCGFPPGPAGPPGGAGEDQVARLRSALATIRRFAGGRRLVSKRIANNVRIPVLLTAFPAARFVNLVRDGRAVAWSLSRVDWWPDTVVWWAGTTPREWEADGREPWSLCARTWVEELAAVEAGLASVPPAHVLSLTYEDFVAHPTETLDQVAGFAGLGEDRRWPHQLARLSFPDRNQAWRDGLGPEHVRAVESIQGDALRRHGYVA